VKIGLANLAYNMRRFVWLDGRNAPAAAAWALKRANQRTRHLENLIPIDRAIAAGRSPTILQSAVETAFLEVSS
jgi:hypothetical protein